MGDKRQKGMEKEKATEYATMLYANCLSVQSTLVHIHVQYTFCASGSADIVDVISVSRLR